MRLCSTYNSCVNIIQFRVCKNYALSNLIYWTLDNFPPRLIVLYTLTAFGCIIVLNVTIDIPETIFCQISDPFDLTLKLYCYVHSKYLPNYKTLLYQCKHYIIITGQRWRDRLILVLKGSSVFWSVQQSMLSSCLLTHSTRLLRSAGSSANSTSDSELHYGCQRKLFLNVAWRDNSDWAFTIGRSSGREGCLRPPPPAQNVFIFMQFAGKIGQIGWHPSGIGAPGLWEILDPPLFTTWKEFFITVMSWRMSFQIKMSQMPLNHRGMHHFWHC